MPTKYLGWASGLRPGLLRTDMIYWSGDYLRNAIDTGGHKYLRRKETGSLRIHPASLGKFPRGVIAH